MEKAFKAMKIDPKLSISTELGPKSGDRVKGLTIVKPIVYGNVAWPLGEKCEKKGHTHQWKLYVKPYENEDMSGYIQKVHFKLHHSFANPNRIVTKPPYEVTETGWGEFKVVIKIYFNDPFEGPVTLNHILKLLESPAEVGKEPKTGVVAESYDELIFKEPTQLMKHLLTTAQPITDGPYLHHTDFEAKKKAAMDNMERAKREVKEEIEALKNKLKIASQTLATFKAVKKPKGG